MWQNKGPSKTPKTIVPGACEYVTLHDKRDFMDMNKVMGLELERVFLIIQVGLM